MEPQYACKFSLVMTGSAHTSPGSENARYERSAILVYGRADHRVSQRSY